MAYELPAQAQTYIRDHKQELVELVKALCAIPAPSNQEQRRAAFCKDWLEKAGCTGVYIDDALNVVYPVNAESSDQLTLFTAHLDTVFPDLEPLPMEEKDGILHCPGVGDDTANAAILLLLARYIAQKHLQPKDGFLLVCDTGEEALGNLKGIKQIMQDYAGRIKEAYIYDGLYGQAVNWPVAVIRYRGPGRPRLSELRQFQRRPVRRRHHRGYVRRGAAGGLQVLLQCRRVERRRGGQRHCPAFRVSH